MRKFAILIGIDNYRDEGISALRCAVADAVGVGAELRDRCGFDSHDIRLLTGEAATYQAIDRAMKELARALRPEDLLVFFFAGHGIEVDSSRYLLTHDCLLTRPDRELAMKDLKRWLSDVEATQRVIAIDACRNDPRSGRGDAVNPAGLGLARDMQAVMQAAPVGLDSVTACLLACSEGERAFEWPEGGHGLFTHFLIEGIRSGLLDVHGLVDFIRLEVNRFAQKQFRAVQRPWFEQSGGSRNIRLSGAIDEHASVLSPTQNAEKTTAHAPVVNPFDPAIVRRRFEEERRRHEREAVEAREQVRLGAERVARAEQARKDNEFESLKVQLAQDFERRDFEGAGKTVAAMLSLKPDDTETIDYQRFIAAELESIRKRAVIEAEVIVAKAAADFVEVRSAIWQHTDWIGFLTQVRSTVSAAILSDEDIGQLLEHAAAPVRKRDAEAKAQAKRRLADAESQRLAEIRQQQSETQRLAEAERLRRANDRAETERKSPTARPTSTPIAQRPKSGRRRTVILALLWVCCLLLGIVIVINSIKHLAAGNDSAPTVENSAPQDVARADFVEDLGNGTKLKLVRIAAGEFDMGSPESDSDHGTDEVLHHVRLTNGFMMGIYPVTQKQYFAVTGTNPSFFKGDDLPVEKVTWRDAVEFCRKLSAQTSRKYRLPTEAEWEYACRAGTKTAYNIGDGEGALGEAGWYDKNSGGQTHPVGRKKPNVWGLYDMHGNVWEWCGDVYAAYGAGDTINPAGPEPDSNARRVLRGGAWYSLPQACRSACRDRSAPDARDFSVGFRVVLDSQ